MRKAANQKGKFSRPQRETLQRRVQSEGRDKLEKQISAIHPINKSSGLEGKTLDALTLSGEYL
jgi:hypothetical protein